MNTGITIGRMIADAHHVYDAAEKHLEEAKKVGLRDKDLRDLASAIHEVEKISFVIPASESHLETARNALKDSLGRYRIAADLVCNGPTSRHPSLEREMRIGNRFPRTDGELRAYIRGLDKVIHRRSAQLAEHGFGKPQQTELIANGADYQKQLAARGRERGKARSERLKREALLERLRMLTNYVRRTGRAALLDDTARADFDRVTAVPKKKPVVVPPPPAVQPATTT